jgi:DnaJ domain
LRESQQWRFFSLKQQPPEKKNQKYHNINNNMRYDLSFFLCCCKSFLGEDGSDNNGEENFYTLLGLERDASPDEIKRAYKRQSLQMHPDKLAQKGIPVTPEHQAKFTRMKEAYETLSDVHKKETYDAIGERGMRWLDEPFSIDPSELAHNFATSSAYNRSKIFAIFVALAIVILILPILICLHVDGVFGDDASWLATLIPLWLWDVFVLFYHSRVILMGPIQRPDHIPEQDWVDPLPMKKRIVSFVRFALVVLFELLVALKLDHVLPQSVPWFVVFFPLYVWEATTLYKKWPLARMRIVTVEDLELALGKSFADFTAAEKELISKRYSVVPSLHSAEFEVAQKLKTRARHDIIKSAFRILFVICLLVQLDSSDYGPPGNKETGEMRWNWWAVFAPFWIMTTLICYANYQAFAEVQQAAMKKDPTLFGMKKPNTDIETGGGDATGAGTTSNTTTGYGAVGMDGAASPAAAAATTTQQPQSDLTEEEREELKATLMASSSRLCSKCCSQGFLLFVVILFVCKLNGAGFSSLWIISPFLFVAFVILTCLACAIFGITEVPTDGVDFDHMASDFGYATATSTSPAGKTAASEGATPTATNYAPPPSSTTTTAAPSNISGRISSNFNNNQNQANVVIPAPPRETETTAATVAESITTGPASVKSSCAPPPAVSSPMVVVPVMAAHPSAATAATTTTNASSSTGSTTTTSNNNKTNSNNSNTTAAPLSTPLVVAAPPRTPTSSQTDVVVGTKNATAAAPSVAATPSTAAATTPTATSTTAAAAPTPPPVQPPTIDLLDDVAVAAAALASTPAQVVVTPSTTVTSVVTNPTTTGGDGGDNNNELHDLD